MAQKFHFQQAVNCCNISAMAYGLTSLGFPTTVNDLFHGARIPVAYVVNDGMSLAESYDIAMRYIHARRLPLSVMCYHMDPDAVTFDGFWKGFVESTNYNSDDVLVLSFGVNIVHGGRKTGGGHYSMAAAANEETKEITVSDVNAEKYGRYWTTTAQQMYDAMVQKDGSSNRSRGMIQFSKSLDCRPLPGLEEAVSCLPYPFRPMAGLTGAQLHERLWPFCRTW
jgi:hypothetical protein